MRILVISSMTGVMSKTDFVLGGVIPAGNRPFTSVDTLIAASNQGVKEQSIVSVSSTGTIQIWQGLTKNNGEWAASTYYIDGMCLTWLT